MSSSSVPPGLPARPAPPERAGTLLAGNLQLPANGHVLVGDLVITMLELREEQYDHRPEKGDVLSARVHVRRAGAPAPTRAAMEADTSAHVRVTSDGEASSTRWESVEIILVGGDRNAAVLELRSHP